MSELTEFRESKDHFMGHDDQAPLTPEQQQGFGGLSYYDDDPSLNLVLDVDTFDNPQTIEMQTSTGDVAEYIRWGRVSFDVDGESAELTLFKDSHGHGVFLPFADATSGSETYGAGRYIDVEVSQDDKASVDFNYAYNPYCAYNEMWSCPLTPSENRLKVPIRAGEKSFK